MRFTLSLIAVLLPCMLPASACGREHPLQGAAIRPGLVDLRSLLDEMRDTHRLALWPDPPYTTGQFSSFDRASTTPAHAETWFANRDHGHFLRTESRDGRTEYVMMDAGGPGAVVRIWSANPRGTLRIYLDHAEAPVIEAPMADLLGGRWKPGEHAIADPFAGVRARGYNLFLPIPYAQHCRITSDEGGFYYLINHRTYPKGTQVATFSPGQLDSIDLPGIADLLLTQPAVGDDSYGPSISNHTLAPGQRIALDFPEGPRSILWLGAQVRAADLEAALRSTVLVGTFDGNETIWCPLGDFFGSGVGLNPFRDYYRAVLENGLMTMWWTMPYLETAELALVNHGQQPVDVDLLTDVSSRDERPGIADRLMHFHARWRHQYPLPTRPFRDWNYVEITGRGVYIGDSLAVMNPVPQWWGEGDEKIYVDGEAFPSHFGTGTEDYYGYAWCSPEPFQHLFHVQARSDGHAHGNNWGHTTVGRVRALDAIPFAQSLKVDMEVWHWKECDVAYAATTYFYARPGALTNLTPSPEEAARPIPQPPPLPPPFRIEGVIECEAMEITARSEDLEAVRQDMRSFASRTWSDERHLWVRARQPGDFIELTFAAPVDEPHRITLHATRSWDYGIVRFSVNGQPAGEAVDLASGQRGRVEASGPIELGIHQPLDGQYTIRAELTGSGPQTLDAGTFFGLDAVVLRRRE